MVTLKFYAHLRRAAHWQALPSRSLQHLKLAMDNHPFVSDYPNYPIFSHKKKIQPRVGSFWCFDMLWPLWCLNLAGRPKQYEMIPEGSWMISRAKGLTLTVNSQQHFCRGGSFRWEDSRLEGWSWPRQSRNLNVGPSHGDYLCGSQRQRPRKGFI